jgi:hypothetical protein
MKIKVTFKTPDAVEVALQDQLGDNLDKFEEAVDFINMFVRYGETITVEFDTLACTARVLKK